MSNNDDNDLTLIEALYLLVLYLSGGDTHNEYLANPTLRSSSRSKLESKETFLNIQSWIGLEYGVLDQLEEKDLLSQPQKGGRKRRTYIEMNKRGMQKARMLLQYLNIEGAKEALEARNYHEEYINHKNKIELERELNDEINDSLDEL